MYKSGCVVHDMYAIKTMLQTYFFYSLNLGLVICVKRDVIYYESRLPGKLNQVYFS